MFRGLRNLKTIATILVNRIELYSKLMAVEAKIETSLIIRRLVWVAVGLVFTIFTLAMIHVVLLSWFWYSEYRLISTLLLFLLDGVIAGTALYTACKPAKQEVFAVTKQQLANDIEFVKESI